MKENGPDGTSTVTSGMLIRRFLGTPEVCKFLRPRVSFFLIPVYVPLLVAISRTQLFAINRHRLQTAGKVQFAEARDVLERQQGDRQSADD